MSQDKEFEQQSLSEDEIDDIVTAQADDDSAWEAPIEVKRNRSAMSYSTEREKKPIQTIDRIREVRHQISERFGHDPEKVVAYYADPEKDYTGRFLDEKNQVKSAAQDKPLNRK